MTILSIGEDYDAVAMFQMDYEPNSPLNSVRCVNITIRDDLIVEPDQFFQVALTTSDPVFLTPISMATVVIATDNDSKSHTQAKLLQSVCSCVCVCVDGGTAFACSCQRDSRPGSIPSERV